MSPRWSRTAAGLVLALGVLGGCGHPPPAPNTLRFDVAADPTTLNPLFLHPDASSVELQLARLLFEPFVDLDARGRPQPALLARIPSVANGDLSRDGRTIVFRLRPGVRWSDGTPVTSDDVLFTLHAILDPDNPVRSHAGYDLIDRAVAGDPRTVVFHLRRAWAPAAVTYFSYGAVPQFVLPAHVLRHEAPLERAAFNAAPGVGDGPYRFAWWHRGDGLRFVANARYWRGAPRIGALDVRIVPDPSTNLLMLRSGALDWNLIAPVQRASLQAQPDLQFVSVPTAVVAGLALNAARGPLADVRVRRALAMSVDRAAISSKITLGAYPVTNVAQPQFSWAYDPAIRQPAFDPKAADALLDAAGWTRGPDGARRKNGVPLRLVYVAFPESMTGVRVAAFVQRELTDRGIEATIKSVSNAQLFLPRTGVLAAGNFDLAYVPWTMGADPDDSAILACGGSENYMRWCDPAVDALERRALASTSQAERRTLYGRIGRIAARDVPVMYLFNADYVYAYGRRLDGFSPNAFLPTWNAGVWSLRR
ncbi:MAG: peptide ABC transporter substrate-binding protein [Vulcanimicrobiaceae bacterium]